MVFAMITVGLSFVACEKEEDAFSGFYLTEPWDWDGVHMHCKALNFINKNTVKVYGTVLNYEHWGEYSEYIGIDYWYIQDYSMATYSVIENKIYIPSEGMILTIDGDKLYPDGSSYPYIKYKAGASKSESLKGQKIKFVKKQQQGLYTELTHTATFDFVDDVSFVYNYVCEVVDYTPDGEVKEYHTNEFNGTYICSGDKIEYVMNQWGSEWKGYIIKSNGRWQWEDYPDYTQQM